MTNPDKQGPVVAKPGTRPRCPCAHSALRVAAPPPAYDEPVAPAQLVELAGWRAGTGQQGTTPAAVVVLAPSQPWAAEQENAEGRDVLPCQLCLRSRRLLQVHEPTSGPRTSCNTMRASSLFDSPSAFMRWHCSSHATLPVAVPNRSPPSS